MTCYPELYRANFSMSTGKIRDYTRTATRNIQFIPHFKNITVCNNIPTLRQYITQRLYGLSDVSVTLCYLNTYK